MLFPRGLSVLGLVIAITLLVCAGWVAAEDARRLVALGDGQQEIPPTGSTGWVAGIFDVDIDANTVSYRIVHTGFATPEIDAHIHGPADSGVPGPPLETLPLGQLKVGVWNYDEALEVDILEGRTYVNIHTADFPLGEVRAQMSRFICDLDGDQETSTVSTAAMGFGAFDIDTNANELSYFVAFSGTTSLEIAAHIHGPANYGEPAPPVADLPLGSPKIGVWNYPQNLEQAILDGRMYVNIHTNDFSAGEIRGQITASVSPMDGDQETPTVSTSAVGVCLMAVDPTSATFGYDIRHVGLSSPENAAHIHGPAPIGEPGPPIVDLPPGNRKLGSEVVTPDEIDDFFACLLYVNVHSEVFTSGEIRGQLFPGDASPRFIRGDFNGDGEFNALVDAIGMLSFGFRGGPPPLCAEAADASGDGEANFLVDAIYVLSHGFVGGPPPPAPHPSCGVDPNPESSFGCESVECS